MVEPEDSDSPAPPGPRNPAAPKFDETLPGCTSALLLTEITAWPFLIGFLGCGYAGYWFGADRFPGTGAAYALAILGGLVGIFAGFAVVGAAAGAFVGGLIGWCLRSTAQWVTGADSDPYLWWPIYIFGGLGGLMGMGVAVNATIKTISWWRKR